MTFLVIIGLIALTLLLSRSRTSNRSISQVAPGTLIITCSDGSRKEHEYSVETNSYYHEETAADYLCQPEKHVLVEIKDVNGTIYTYTNDQLKKLGWL